MIQYINIKLVIDNLLLHPLLQDLSLERAVNYAVEFIRIVGCPLLFTNKVAELTLKDYRCLLPCDFINIILVRDKNGHSYRNTTDTFHLKLDNKETLDLTYKLLNNVLYSNTLEGDIEVSYEAMELDSDGFPLIADNSSFIKALELYIKKQWFTILFDLGKISLASLLNVLLEYGWYVGLAQTSLIKPTIDQMQSITAMWNLLLVKNNEHKRFFKNTGSTEYIKIH